MKKRCQAYQARKLLTGRFIVGRRPFFNWETREVWLERHSPPSPLSPLCPEDEEVEATGGELLLFDFRTYSSTSAPVEEVKQ